MNTIPVVNMSCPDLAALPEEERRKKLGYLILGALKDIGFVYLKNAEISSKLRQDTVQSALQFFALPAETKLKYHRFVRTRCNGFTPMNGEHLILSETEAKDVQLQEVKESWDMMVLGEDMPDDIAPAFSENILQLMVCLDNMSKYVYRALEEAMGRPGMLSSIHEHQLEQGNSSVLRVVHYPPVPEGVPAGAVRCATHSDWGTLTLLLQDQVGGLEVLARDGTWVQAVPLSDTVLVNVGDLMEILTGGQLRATKHRVRLPQIPRQREAHRVSLVLFGQPDDDVTITPPRDAAGFEAVNAGEYLKSKYMATIGGFKR